MTDLPKALVIRAAGTNCDAEMARAFELAGARAELVHVDRLIAAPGRVADFDMIGFPGGFSYGDDIASGRVLAMKVRQRLADELRAVVARGTPILGVCNGFQTLAQIGLLPGGKKNQAPHPHPLSRREGAEQSVALTDNIGGRFIDEWVGVEFPESRCVWTRDLWPAGDAHARDALRLPIAHGEGRFTTDSSETLRRLQDDLLVAARYLDNVNGSAGAIAGLCDRTGLVLGLMPHPERFTAWTQHPCWTRLDRALWDLPTPGLKMFRNAVEHVRRGRRHTAAIATE